MVTGRSLFGPALIVEPDAPPGWFGSNLESACSMTLSIFCRSACRSSRRHAGVGGAGGRRVVRADHDREACWNGPVAFVSPVRYAQAGAVSLAYQLFGKGDRDVVVIPPMAHNIETMWERWEYRRVFEGMGRFCRVVHFDKRGHGRVGPDGAGPDDG